MTLSEKQQDFCLKISYLIQWAWENGYRLTFGDAFRDPRVHGSLGEKKAYGNARSCHKLRLAVDFNLFKDGQYLTSTEDYRPLGEYWESLGGSWGGRFQDGNHFSLEHQGTR